MRILLNESKFQKLKILSDCNVASRSTSQLVAHLRIFRPFMKGKFDAYLLRPSGLFTNYVYKTRYVGGPKISTFCQHLHHR